MLEHIRSFLPAHLRHVPGGDQVRAAITLQAANVILVQHFPTTIAGYVRAEKIRDGTLTLRVTHPGVAQAVRSQEAGILTALQKNHPTVRRLVLHVGAL